MFSFARLISWFKTDTAVINAQHTTQTEYGKPVSTTIPAWTLFPTGKPVDRLHTVCSYECAYYLYCSKQRFAQANVDCEYTLLLAVAIAEWGGRNTHDVRGTPKIPQNVARVWYFAYLSIIIAKIGDYSQSRSNEATVYTHALQMNPPYHTGRQ